VSANFFSQFQGFQGPADTLALCLSLTAHTLTLILAHRLVFFRCFTLSRHHAYHTEQGLDTALVLLLTHAYCVPLGHPIGAHELRVQRQLSVVVSSDEVDDAQEGDDT